MAFHIYNHKNQHKGDISKTELNHILNLLNNALVYFGDRPLQIHQITDLINSIYTTLGLIDGDIQFHDIMHILITHPIIELLLSVQYQGSHVLNNSNNTTNNNNYNNIININNNNNTNIY